MLKFKDIVRYICATVLCLYKYIKDLLRMDSVYDCTRPFMLVRGIFGLGGNTLCEIEGVRSVRNTRFSLFIAAFISLVITPAYLIRGFRMLFSGEQRALLDSIILIMMVRRFFFIIPIAAMTCIQTHACCKNITKVLQILNNTDMMLKQENIHVNYWKIILKTILFGVISCSYPELQMYVNFALMYISPALSIFCILRLFLDISCEIYFMWMILFMLIIRERFVGLNKLLQQNAQVPSIIQDDSLLRRISLARDIHEQLSEAVALFSDSSRFIIIGVLVPGMLESLLKALDVAILWTDSVLTEKVDNTPVELLLLYSHAVVLPIIKIVVLTAVCETHKNNRRVLTARLRHMISREEDPAIVHQPKQYIWFNYDTVAGLVDFQLVDVDFTLLFTVMDIIISYIFLIYSYYRPSYTVNPN